MSPAPSPVVTYRGPSGPWRLERGYVVRDGRFRLRIPRGFEFDAASIPRVCWWLIGPVELSLAAPLAHDFLYRCGGCPEPGVALPARTWTRAEADRLFRVVMAAEGVPRWRRGLAYLAVRLFGWRAWRDPA